MVKNSLRLHADTPTPTPTPTLGHQHTRVHTLRLNEKKPDVGVNQTVTGSVWLSVLMFIVLGWTAAGAFPSNFRDSADDITSVLTLPTSHVSETTRLAAYFFPPVVLWSGIPVFAIIIRYNLLQGAVMMNYKREHAYPNMKNANTHVLKDTNRHI